MRRRRWLIRGLNGLILLLVGWLLLAAAYVSLGRLLVPTVANYQEELVGQVEQLTGRHIELRSLQGQMQGAQPVLTLRGLRVHESLQPDSEVLFDLDDVTARLDVWRSLWLRRPVMDALQIRGLALTLSEDEQGQWHMQGVGERTRRLGALEQHRGGELLAERAELHHQLEEEGLDRARQVLRPVGARDDDLIVVTGLVNGISSGINAFGRL